MTKNRTHLYEQLLAMLANDLDDDARPLLVLAATTLVRPWELLDPQTVVRHGEVLVPEIVFNNMRNVARAIPLAATIEEELCGRTDTVYDLLQMPPNRRGVLIELHRMALPELELHEPIALEQLIMIHLAALVENAPTPAHVQAALSAAGIPAKSVIAARLRAETLDEHLPWVAQETDRMLSRALGLRNAHPTAHGNRGA